MSSKLIEYIELLKTFEINKCFDDINMLMYYIIDNADKLPF